MSSTKATGLVIFHDPRNEDYLIKDGLARAAATGPAEVVIKTKNHRQHWSGNQNGFPECTAFGTMTNLCCQPYGYKKALADPRALYKEIQAYDRMKGRHFSEGATVNAAMEVIKTKGWITEYRWAYTLRTCQEAIQFGPLIAGTNWYPSMMERDNQGIVKLPGLRERPDGGHLFCLNGYDHKRGLWRSPSTWGDGIYLIPDELMLRLIREEGEMCMLTETPKVRKLLPAA